MSSRVLLWLLLLAAVAGVRTLHAQSARTPTIGELRMRPGVSLTLAEHRTEVLSDVEYDLFLDLTGEDRARGILLLSFDRAPGAGDLIVDFAGPRLTTVRANAAVVDDFAWTNGHIRIPARYLRVGRNRLGFRFAAEIAPSGAPVIRVDEPADSASYLYTLLVPAAAHRLFPGFDQPDLKGRFELELLAPEQWSVLANGPVASRTPTPRGVRWSFEETKPISTYLFAFAAGPWKTWTSAPAGELPITLYARRSRADAVDAERIMRINRDAVRWLEDYFRVDYPFQKFSILLAPAFPFGGMEHVGAIYYDEQDFIFREEPTLLERLGRKNTIYHEVAHQWFGDLVTMPWFDDLWLKEGFASYMAAKMQQALDPGTGAWKTFYISNKPAAYRVDVTAGTTPVWQELPNLNQAKSNYGPIVYDKAPAILKQLEYLVGEEAFRAGVQLFLERHAYDSATWRDLLAALEEASDRSLDRFGEYYILRAGAPIVETRLEARADTIARLALVQRSTVEPRHGDQSDDGGGWWPGRVRVRLGYADREDVTLPVAFTGDTTVVTGAAGLPAPDWVFANAGDYGYGLFLLGERTADYMLEHIGEVGDDLLRAQLWGGLWRLVRRARLDPVRYLEVLLRELPAERDQQISALLLNRAETALTRYLTDAERAAIVPRFEQTLLARAENPELSYGLRKAALDSYIDIARTPEAVAVLEEYLAGERRFDGEPLGQPTRWDVVTTLLALGAPGAHELYAAEQARDTTPSAEREAFIAGAAIPTAENKAEYFRRYLNDAELNESWVAASLGAFSHPAHSELTLEYLRPALEKLPWIREHRRIFFLPRWVNAFIGGQSSAEALEVVDTYLAEHPELREDLRRKVLVARDALARAVRVRGE